MPVPTAPMVVLSDDERETLERWARRHPRPRRSSRPSWRRGSMSPEPDRIVSSEPRLDASSLNGEYLMALSDHFRSVLGEEACGVVDVGATLQRGEASRMLQAMADHWSFSDSRGRPRVGGARPEIRELTVRIAEAIDQEGATLEIPELVGAELARGGYGADASTLAWVVFVATIATEGYVRGVANSEQYQLLAHPYLRGAAPRSADLSSPSPAAADSIDAASLSIPAQPSPNESQEQKKRKRWFGRRATEVVACRPLQVGATRGLFTRLCTLMAARRLLA